MTWWTREPDQWIELADCTLPYWREGTGPDVVFVHGWPLDSRTWRDTVAVLKDRFTCHLIDLPGTGQSKFTKATRAGLRENADALGQVIDQLGLDSYALVAHDSGGVFTRLQAAREPDKVWGMVLGNTEIPGHTPWMLTLLVAAMRLPGRKASMRLMLGSKLLRRLPFAFGGAFDDVGYADAGAFYEAFIQPLLESDQAFAGQQLLAAGLDPRVLAELKPAHAAIKAPVQLLWGKDDPWFPLDHARSMAEQFGGEVEVTPMAGKLFVHEEHSQAWATAAGEFLARAAGV